MVRLSNITAVLFCVIVWFGALKEASAVWGEQLYKFTWSDTVDVPGSPIDSLPPGPTIAIDGTMAIMGVAEDDEVSADSGAAYLIDVTNGTQLHKLKASDPHWSANFGGSVAIDGQRMIVGAPVVEYASNAGAAYVFDVKTGNEIFRLADPVSTGDDNFGQAVDIYGDRAIIGAPGAKARRFGDDLLVVLGSGPFRPGRAYVFDVRTGAELYTLSASDGALGDLFGNFVAMQNDRAIVSGSGAAYVFDLVSGTELSNWNRLTARLGTRWTLTETQSSWEPQSMTKTEKPRVPLICSM